MKNKRRELEKSSNMVERRSLRERFLYNIALVIRDYVEQEKRAVINT